MLVNRRKFNRVTEYYSVQGLHYTDGTEPNRDPTENYRDGTDLWVVNVCDVRAFPLRASVS
eukprot:COSAG02_NODE_3548_length_6580_cov_2104.438358_6_plen_61_part_00